MEEKKKKQDPSQVTGYPKDVEAFCQLFPCGAKVQEQSKDRKEWLLVKTKEMVTCQHLATYAHTALQNQENAGAGRLIQEAS